MSGKKSNYLLGVMLLAALLGPTAFRFYRNMRTENVIENYLEAGHWGERRRTFDSEKRVEGGIVFLGNSLTELFDLSVFGDSTIVNRGISGDFTSGVLLRLDDVTGLKPKKIFLEIGINDLVENAPPQRIVQNQERIIEKLQEKIPGVKIYVQSLLPTDLPSGLLRTSEQLNEAVRATNTLLKNMCGEKKLAWIDLYPLLEKNGRLAPEYSLDGIHLTDAAYAVWKKAVEPYVNE